MRKCIDWMKAHPWLMKRVTVLILLLAVGGGSFFWGQRRANGKAVTDVQKSGERVVALMYNNIPVTRQELGEYLVDRLGQERLEFMLNRKIVEIECAKQNIVATDAEVEQRFMDDVRAFGGSSPTPITRDQFVNVILKRFGKSEFEWREDVIRPKILMEKLVQASVKITDQDVREGFEAKYGPKVDCRMIVVDKGNRYHAQKVWEEAYKGRPQFLEQAKKQFIPTLASAEGKVPPIHRHFGDKQLEDAAFRLQKGQISGLLEMKDGTYVILMCEEHLPATAARYEDEKVRLAKEVHDLRVAQRIPEAFKKLREEANVRNMLANQVVNAVHVAPPPELRSRANDDVPKPLPPIDPPPFKPLPVEPKDGKKPMLPDAPPQGLDIPRPMLPPSVAPMPTLTPMPMQTPSIGPPPGLPSVPQKKG